MNDDVFTARAIQVGGFQPNDAFFYYPGQYPLFTNLHPESLPYLFINYEKYSPKCQKAAQEESRSV